MHNPGLTEKLNRNYTLCGIHFKTETMYKVNFILLFLFLSFHKGYSAQNTYKINMPEPSSRLSSGIYYFHSVLDKRIKSKGNGSLIDKNGSQIPVEFEVGIENTLLNYIQQSVPGEQAYIPLILVIDQLHIKDAGSLKKHTLTLDIKLSVVRILEDKEFILLESSGSPSYISQGYTAGLAEKLIQQSIDPFIKGFDEYVRDNSDQQVFCNRTEIEFVYDKSFTDYSNYDTIRWDPNYKLKWEDFQGKADPASTFSAQSNCMFSFRSGIEYKGGVMKLSLYLYPCFTKKASWVVPENKQDGLLAHEQLHFDICELYIRRLRKTIAARELSVLDPGKEIQDEFEKAWKDYQSAQSQYDRETRHGLIRDQQESWVKKVNEELEGLKEFATRPATK